MILEKITVNNKPRYLIQEAVKGRNYGTIAYYDSFEQAALVMRYLKGANMPPADQAAALRLIFGWDAREIITKEPAEQ